MPTPLENDHRASVDGAAALFSAHRFDASGDWPVLPWCIGHVAPCVAVGHVQASSRSMPAAARTAGAMIALNCNRSATAISHDERRRTDRITGKEYHFPTIPSLDTRKIQRDTGINGRGNSRGHRSSVGEAPAQHTGHCPSISREIARGRTEIPGTRVFLRWLGLAKPLRSAVLKLGREGTRHPPHLRLIFPRTSDF
jgi:hypothetical protein